MKLIAPGSSRRETVKIRPLSLLIALAIAVALGSGCEEELAPQITQFVLDPDCEVMQQHSDGVYLSVQYFARASGGNRFDDPTGTNSALEFFWNFGDGSTAKNRVSGFHKYTSPGTYTVKLSVKDKDGDEAQIEGEVFVGALGTDLDVLDISTESGYSTLGVQDRNKGYVAKIDVTDPANPAIIGSSLSLKHSSDNAQASVTGMDGAIVGDQLYVAAGSRGLRRIDLNGFNEVSQVLRVPGISSEFDAVNGITVDGSTAYLALNDGLMRRVDVSNPAAPSLVLADSLVGLLDPEPGSGQDVIIHGAYAYIANLDGLKGISLPDLPNSLADSVVVGFALSPGPAVGVAVSNNTAYIADGTVGLGVYDITSRLEPVRIDWLGTEGRVQNMAVVGGRGYMSDDTGGFYVVSTDAGAPSVLGYTNTPGAVMDVTIVGNYAYAANSGGLQIIDISDDANPTIVGEVLTLGNATAALHDGGSTVYVVYNGINLGWDTPVEGTLTTPCPSSNLVQEFEWVWEFGDGSDPLTHSANPVHRFAPLDDYMDYWVKLRVTERQTDISRLDSLLVNVPSF